MTALMVKTDKKYKSTHYTYKSYHIFDF